MPEISVVMACRDSAATLAETLEGLLAQESDRAWEIVLADNGSTDDTRAIFARFAAARPGLPMRVVDASARVGKCVALNAAIRAGTAPKILILDGDDVPAPGWLEAMARALDHHAFVHAAREWRRLNPPWAVAARPPEPEDWRYWRWPYAPLAAGATHGFRREVFDAVGGFDEAFGSGQDLRFCIEAHLKGFDLVPAPGAVVHYRLRDDPGAIFRQHRAYARGVAQLRRCYPSGSPLLGPWKLMMLGRRLILLGAEGAARRLAGAPRDDVAAADYARRLGLALGDLQGSLAFRVAPAERPPRVVRWLRRRRPAKIGQRCPGAIDREGLGL